jgi:hypothetical protein
MINDKILWQTEKATMADLKSVMRALSKGTPIMEIERQLRLSRRSIAVYRDRAEQ